MKRLLSLVLSAALLCTLGVPALAAGGETTTDQRLAAVTEKVKGTLALDTTKYTSFHGDLEESPVTPTWQLQWSGENGDLMVTATEEGKILSYTLFDGQNEVASYPRSFGASLPKLSRADAQKTAQSFLDKVLDSSLERAQFEDEGMETLSASSHSFYGTLLENGLPTPFSFRISVRVSDNTVTSFYRNGSAEDYLGGVPSPTPAADAAKAGESLFDTLKLRLEYVLSEDGKTATLRYLPETVHDYYVDAQSGKRVDLTELQQELWEKGAGGGMTSAPAPSAAPDTASRGESTLTEAELAGVASMEGVLSKDALDAAARKLTALGLGKYTFARVDYRLDKETEEVSAALQYAYKNGDFIYRRNVTLDAKTGALISLYSSRPWKENEKATLTETQAVAKAEAFLKEICPDQFAKTAAYGDREQGKSVSYSFQYAQKENGYFLPDSTIYVSVDGTDGSISEYRNQFVPGVVFESAEGIITLEAARRAWFETYDVTLGYLAVPEKLDLSEPRWKPLFEMGRSFLYTRKLAYYLERDGWYLGIDAKSGEAVQGASGQPSTVAYSDLDSHWVKAQAETLAKYGVGWLGGAMNPAAAMTQLDLVALLVSTGGYLYDSTEESAADRLYNTAYSMGILQKAERNDNAPVTRADLTKLLLDSAGYSNIAGLEGIFTCAFADEAAIPAAYYGYAAVAQALGLVKGDKSGSFAAERIATRAEGVSMLYNFMTR